MTVLYPRDLNGTLLQDFLNDLKNKRPDLLKAYEEGEDITIGEVEYFEPEKWTTE
ncbi:hypothetical protein LCGC14_2050370 [marine sediment metagenome]|uniref:Uncharacterized protein n=1 Tax=marine sediment metagenome TaxID=412755 RepID=A0A0F9HL66_9ZZZZ